MKLQLANLWRARYRVLLIEIRKRTGLVFLSSPFVKSVFSAVCCSPCLPVCSKLIIPLLVEFVFMTWGRIGLKSREHCFIFFSLLPSSLKIYVHIAVYAIWFYFHFPVFCHVKPDDLPRWRPDSLSGSISTGAQTVQRFPYPDRTLHSFRASKFDDLRISCCSETSIVVFQGLKNVKFRSGNYEVDGQATQRSHFLSSSILRFGRNSNSPTLLPIRVYSDSVRRSANGAIFMIWAHQNFCTYVLAP